MWWDSLLAVTNQFWNILYVLGFWTLRHFSLDSKFTLSYHWSAETTYKKLKEKKGTLHTNDI